MSGGDFEAVVLPHLGAAYNLARWLTRNPTDAEDVVQEAVVRAATYFAGFRGTNPRAWLLQIVRNTAYSSRALVRGAVMVSLPGEDGEGATAPELVDRGDDPETALLKREGGTRLRRLLTLLPAELREALILREIEELPYKEIAEVTQTPIGTVMSRLWRARRMLAAAVTAEGRAMSMECDNILLVQAEFDGELDAVEALRAAEHRRNCAECRQAYEAMTTTRRLLRQDSAREAVPESLRRAIAAKLATDAPAAPKVIPMRRAWWRDGASVALGAALAAGIAFFVIAPAQQDVVDQIVASHVRALQPGHLEDVISTDQHTVKPWFDGRIDFAPPVKDLKEQHFPLLGGRLDYLDNRPVAALVYGSDKHLIDLYVWPSDKGASSDLLPTKASLNGYNTIHWQAGGMNFWAVSDLEASSLDTFVRDWRASS